MKSFENKFLSLLLLVEFVYFSYVTPQKKEMLQNELQVNWSKLNTFLQFFLQKLSELFHVKIIWETKYTLLGFFNRMTKKTETNAFRNFHIVIFSAWCFVLLVRKKNNLSMINNRQSKRDRNDHWVDLAVNFLSHEHTDNYKISRRKKLIFWFSIMQ